MLRTIKKHIVVLIVADRGQVEEALESAREASIYADVVYVALPRTGKIEDAAAAVAAVPKAKLIRVTQWSVMSTQFRKSAYSGVTADQIGEVRHHVVLFLEAGQWVDDPEIVRPTVERNDGKILTAIRQFKWDEEHYRVDGIYMPARFPVIGEVRKSIWWDSHLSTAPAWMWSSSSLWVDAPFKIIDPTYMNPANRLGDGAPKLEPTRGRLFA